MAHEVETMAYAGQKPWHGLGNQVDPNSTPEEMLQASGLDWEVEKRRMFIGENREAGDGTILVPNKNALVRLSDGKVLTTVSDGWHPLQNQEAMTFFKKYTEAGHMSLETAGSLKGGRLIWALAKLNHNYNIGANDQVEGYLMLTSQHQVGTSIGILTSAIRVVCANTMQLALRSEHSMHWNQNHMSEFDTEGAQAQVELAHEQLSAQEQVSLKLLKLKMSDEDSIRFLASKFQPELEEDAINDPANWTPNMTDVVTSWKKAPGATPGTAWGVINGITHYTDHVQGRKVNARLVSAWFGKNQRLKLDAQKELLEMAA